MSDGDQGCISRMRHVEIERMWIGELGAAPNAALQGNRGRIDAQCAGEQQTQRGAAGNPPETQRIGSEARRTCMFHR